MIRLNTEDFGRTLKKNDLIVFDINQASMILRKNKNYTSHFLSRARSKKKIARIYNGVYCLNPLNPYVSGIEKRTLYGIASKILPHSYLTTVSAYDIWNLTKSTYSKIYVASALPHKPVRLGKSLSINFIRLRPELIFGYIDLNGTIVAEPQKAILDDIYLGSPIDGEILDAINSLWLREKNTKGIFNPQKFIRYAKRFETKSLLNKLGLLLDYFGYEREANALLLHTYRKKLVNISGFSDSELRNKGNAELFKINKKWNVIYSNTLKRNIKKYFRGGN